MPPDCGSTLRRDPRGGRSNSPSGANEKEQFYECLRSLVDALVTGLIEGTVAAAESERSGARGVEAVGACPGVWPTFRADVAEDQRGVEAIPAAKVYTSHPPQCRRTGRKVDGDDPSELFRFFVAHPEHLPAAYADEKPLPRPVHRVVCGYIAGMTDHFLLRQCREILRIPVSEAE